MQAYQATPLGAAKGELHKSADRLAKSNFSTER